MKIDFSQFDALIFDMDGTLVDSMPIWRYNVWIEYMLIKGVTLRMSDIEEVTAKGSGSQVMPQIAEREGVKLGTMDEIYDELNVIMEDHYRLHIPLKKSVMPFLDQMKKMGLRMCVATSTREPVARKALEWKKIDGYFEFVTGDRELKIRKHEPDYFRKVAEKMGVAPEKCLIFEDAAYSIRAAKAGGMKVVAIKDEMAMQSVDEIKMLADWYVEDYAELLG